MYCVQGIGARLGGRTILEDVDIALRAGEIVVIIGPNGAGKSTALKVLSGEIGAASGRVLLDGRSIRDIPAATLARSRAVLPQAATIAFPFTAHEIVRLGAEAGGARAAAVETICRAALSRVGMAACGGRMMQTLSGGEAQRVHLARALAQAAAGRVDDRAFYLLLDEPTSSLDLEHQLLTLRIAREFAASGGGVLAVLHDLNLAVMAADRLVAMKAGRIVAQGRPAEILTDDLLTMLYNTRLTVSRTPPPPMPFVLPQTASGGPRYVASNETAASAALQSIEPTPERARVRRR